MRLDKSMGIFGFGNHAIHTAPLIRREDDYANRKPIERKQIFNRIFHFARNTDYCYQAICVDKRQLVESFELNARLSKQLAGFLFEKFEWLSTFDKIVVYYDNGQIELTRILVSVFNAVLNKVEFRKILPVDYKLAQVADLICTLEYLSIKVNEKSLSKSELAFFGSARELEKNYLRHIRKKRIG